MSKVEIVSAQLQALQVGETQVKTDVLGATFDAAFNEGVASVPVSPGGASEEQILARIAEALAPVQAALDAQLAKDVLDEEAIKSGQDALVILQGQFDVLAQKESVETAIIAGLQNSKAQIEAALASLAGLALP